MSESEHVKATIRIVELHTGKRHIIRDDRLVCNLQIVRDEEEKDRSGEVVTCIRCWEAAGKHLNDEEKHMAALAMSGL